MLQVEVCKSEGWQPQQTLDPMGSIQQTTCAHRRDSTPPVNRRWVAGWNSICWCLLIFRDANLCFIYTCPIRYHVSLLPFSAPSLIFWAALTTWNQWIHSWCEPWPQLNLDGKPPAPSVTAEGHWVISEKILRTCIPIISSVIIDIYHIIIIHIYIYIYQAKQCTFFLANHPKKNTILQGTSAAGDLA